MFRTRQLPMPFLPTAPSPKRRTQPRYLRFWVHHGRGGEKVVRFPETQTFVPDNWWLERRTLRFLGPKSHFLKATVYVIVLGRVCLLTLHFSWWFWHPFCIYPWNVNYPLFPSLNREGKSMWKFMPFLQEILQAPNVEGHQQPLSLGTRIPQKKGVEGLPSL